MPRSPADLTESTATLLELMDQYYDHSFVLVRARAEGQAESARLLVQHAVAALAIAQVIVEDLLSERASLVRMRSTTARLPSSSVRRSAAP
jgi:hypothetical protein